VAEIVETCAVAKDAGYHEIRLFRCEPIKLSSSTRAALARRGYTIEDKNDNNIYIQFP